MATIDGNDLAAFFRGSFGKQFVFRRYKNRMVVSSYPVFKKKKHTSPEQAQTRTNFTTASVWAKLFLKNPIKKAEYKAIANLKGLPTAHIAATQDFMTSTELEAIKFDWFHPVLILSIILKDNYKGEVMKVSIADEDGNVVESGNASFSFGTDSWQYACKSRDLANKTLNISLEVKDRPGRVVKFERSLEVKGGK